jgi:hypothetical protein
MVPAIFPIVAVHVSLARGFERETSQAILAIAANKTALLIAMPHSHIHFRK